MLASYHPDFIVVTADKVVIVETKSDKDALTINVQRKKTATIEWCNKINTLQPDDRMDRQWEYILLSEQQFSFVENGATFEDLCRMCKVSKHETIGTLFEV